MDIPDNLILKQMPVGPMENFIYFIGDQGSKEIAVIDPAWDVPYLIREAKNARYTITNIFLTHGHMDHVNGIDEMQETFDVPVTICEHEADFYTPDCKNLIKNKADEKLKIGGIELKTLYLPGHSPGCQAFIYKNVMIAGDAIFVDGCGRCDLPGSDPRKMYDSLYNKIMKLPDDTQLFCGHDYGPSPYATVGQQKKTNPYLNCKNIEEFLVHRMGMVM